MRRALPLVVALALACGGGASEDVVVIPPPPVVVPEVVVEPAPTPVTREPAPGPKPPVTVVVEVPPEPEGLSVLNGAIGEAPEAHLNDPKPGTVTLTKAPADAAAEKVVARFTGQLRGCYSSELAQNPGVKGVLTIDLVVAGGRVTSADVRVDEGDIGRINDCVTMRVKRWSFPTEVAGPISATFTFEPTPAVK